MWLAIVLLISLVALVIGICVANDYGIFSSLPVNDPNPMCPKILHLIYLPWGKDQRLLPDPLAFDWTCYNELVENHPDWMVTMWTAPKLRDFSEKHYPGLWDRAWSAAARPTQIVDLYRWVVVYHFGGVYFQYQSQMNVEPEMLLPSKSYGVRLFTEFVWFSPFIRKIPAWRFPIRKGAPEERLRIMNQLFSATPRHPYALLSWTEILARMERMKPSCDYDILFIGANACVSELYERFGSHISDVELLNFWQSRRMVAVSSKGSWRTD